MSDQWIRIRGARENNLKNLDVNIKRDTLTVITGLSGSGKSSLAFDTIYAEGQRRYMESLSSYARQFLGQMEKPKVEEISGLPPAISIDQKSTNHNPRSTVGTVTEIYDYLRLLYARIGIPHCPRCGKEIHHQTIDQMVDFVLSLPEKSKLMILSPVVRGKKGRHEKVFESAKKSGYVRVIVDDNLYDLSEEIVLDKNVKHSIDIVIDRIILKEGIAQRLSESLELAMKSGDGVAIVMDMDTGKRTSFSENYACPDCNIAIEEIEPRSFSFNNPFGACPECMGIGYRQDFDLGLIIPNPSLSIGGGAIVIPGWQSAGKKGSFSYAMLTGLMKKYKFDFSTPIEKLSAKAYDALVYGTGNENVTFQYESHRGKGEYNTAFEGILENVKERYHYSSENQKREYEKYMTVKACRTCKGMRLKQSALAVTIHNKNIYELTTLSVKDILKEMDSWKLGATEAKIAAEVLKEIKARLNFLVNVGLDYLTLARSAATLSGGEAQRIRLATQIGSGLVGVAYILDEPSIGLHQKDNEMLIATLKNLRDIGNTVIVVEHDEDTMRAADDIIDIGPGAGEHGGMLVAQGSPEKILKAKNSLTADYLAGRRKIGIPAFRRSPKGFLTVEGAEEHNLKNITVSFPLGVFTAVTGVSGSGKSSLVDSVLTKALLKELNRAQTFPGKYNKISGIGQLDKIIDIDQSPIGRMPSSNPATYTGAFDLIRDLFAETKEAKARGYLKGRFSFNVKGGRCEECGGAGIKKIEMNFLPDVYVKCEVCDGKRYNRETLECLYKGKSIADILNMRVEEAVDFFRAIPKIRDKVEALNDVGLGYIRLGQPATELSGGEAQRVKLATELSKRSTGKTLYVLDEPTTGLHFEDVRKLIEILQRLTDAGNTVIVIEHNLDVIKSADYIIDLGPDGGDAGGEVIAKGTPEEVAEIKKSYTGQYLKKILGKCEKK